MLGTVRWTAVCRENERMCTGFVWAYIVTQFVYNLEEGVELCRVQFFITKYVFKNIFNCIYYIIILLCTVTACYHTLFRFSL